MRVSNKLPRVQRQVDLLEAAGFEVHMSHDLDITGRLEGGAQVHGITTVIINQPEVNAISLGYGIAYCSESDNFDRSVGTKVAFRRAINDFYIGVGHEKANAVLHPVEDS